MRLLTPAEHDSGQIHGWFDKALLHEHIAGYSKTDVGDVQDPQRHVVVIAFHLQIRGHALDLGIGDVGPIDEGNHEEEDEGGEELEVALPIESPLHRLIHDEGLIMIIDDRDLSWVGLLIEVLAAVRAAWQLVL